MSPTPLMDWATTGKPIISSMGVEGGRAMPSPALPAFMVAATLPGQPVCFIQGMVMEPTAAALPVPEPAIRPNRALAQADT